ncbi:ABC transporter permease [Halorubrum kocurii]|uniref:Binding-protein-dependent transporters inner membrane component n=1 Tax=Halorubrum kocurii JCM 14978 TaxID=1230456 RepID=M0P062_9EURY|nr:ABC transporter permease [Halorubrum kocurii]EMA63547.1 binding-protein-dependent transporters inner membrane component [Halorubrum kocurii JCM 14978]
MSTRQSDSTGEFDERDDEKLFRDRIRENPRPAMVWLAGLAFLLLLEIGRVFAGIGQAFGIVGFVVEILAGIPVSVGDNVAGTLGGAAGFVATAVTAVLMAFALTVPVSPSLPDSAVDILGLDLSRRGTRWAKRVELTFVLVAAAGLVAYTPVGGAFSALIGAITGGVDALTASLPSITSRDLIPNTGHRLPEGGWEGTFLGLSPAVAWAIRTGLVFAYAVTFIVWLWRGFNVYRTHYRAADWTPRDDTVRRFRNNYWGLFGFAIVFLFVVLALWAPAVSPVEAQHNIYEPNAHEFEYLTENGEVTSTTHVFANLQSRSDGQNTVGLMSYDDYDRWAPLGTTNRGQDMMTHLSYGARTSLTIGITAIGLGALIAVVLSLVSSYYKGVTDIATVMASDTIQAVPALLLIMLVSVVFQEADHPIAQPLDGGLLLALIFAFAYWPGMWRSIRGPSLQVSEQEWVDAAKSYGQTPLQTMRKHMAPYIAGYILIYGSLLIGGVIISTAALTFLGLGINPPTPEWGRLIDGGQSYVSTDSWHVATVPGIAIVLVVIAFNALGDAIRDAIDPEADVDESEAAATGGGA